VIFDTSWLLRQHSGATSTASDLRFTGSTPAQALLRSNLRQRVDIRVPVFPSRIVLVLVKG